MSRWTHAICSSCWKKREPKRTPFRMKDPDEEKCCFCGEITQSGIYFRHDPTDKKLFCNSAGWESPVHEGE